MITSDELARVCNADGEFSLAARRWQGALRFHIGDDVLGLGVRDGVARPWTYADADVPTVVYTGAAEAWDQLLAPRPPRFLNDIAPADAAGLVRRSGDELTYWQYYPAIARVMSARAAASGAARVSNPAAGRMSCSTACAGTISNPSSSSARATARSSPSSPAK